MVQCGVIGCRSRSDVHTSLDNKFTFHRLSKDLKNNERLKTILKTEITEYTRICSRHFTEDNFYNTKTGKKRLKSDAVPDVNIELGANCNDTNSDRRLKRKPIPVANLTTDKNMVKEPSNGQTDGSTFQVYTQMNMKKEPDVLSHIPVEPQSNGVTAQTKELKNEVKRLKSLCNKRLLVIRSLRIQNTMLLQKISSLKQALE